MYAIHSVAMRQRRAQQRARRRTAFIAFVLLLGLLGPLAAYVRASSGVQPSEVRVTVRAGDTLWDLAQRHAAPGTDLRELIFEIRRANGLRTSNLYPGQVLVITAR